MQYLRWSISHGWCRNASKQSIIQSLVRVALYLIVTSLELVLLLIDPMAPTMVVLPTQETPQSGGDVDLERSKIQQQHKQLNYAVIPQ